MQVMIFPGFFVDRHILDAEMLDVSVEVKLFGMGVAVKSMPRFFWPCGTEIGTSALCMKYAVLDRNMLLANSCFADRYLGTLLVTFPDLASCPVPRRWAQVILSDGTVS
jgi:hypothetical protein